MNDAQRRQIRRIINDELDAADRGGWSSMNRSTAIDRILDELERIWPNRISADPLGADRAVRTIQSGIGAPPDFGRKSA